MTLIVFLFNKIHFKSNYGALILREKREGEEVNLEKCREFRECEGRDSGS